jgi:hypothetical protein
LGCSTSIILAVIDIYIGQWITEKGLDHYKEVGGHAAKFAERMKLEKCKVFFPGSFNNFTHHYMQSISKFTSIHHFVL